ncbi:MAG: nucleotidyltransferase domain-containing protein [Henriciella sp.]
MNKDEFLKTAIESRTFLESSGIESFVIGGSVGRGTEDAFSDIDVFLVASGTRFSGLTANFTEIAEQFGAVRLFRSSTFIPNYGHSFTALYDDFSIVQFNLNTSETLLPSPLGDQKCITVFDSGIYSDFQSKSRGLFFQNQNVFLKAQTFFWLRAISLVRALERNEIQTSLKYCNDLHTQSLILIRLRAGIAANDPANPSKHIERDLKERDMCWDTIGHFGTDSSSDSLKQFLLDRCGWFNQLSLEVSQMYDAADHPDMAASAGCWNYIHAKLTGAG